jgi:hypothetical protein
MEVKVIDGWIFDVYLAGQDMVVWVIDRDGNAHCLRDYFIPSFYVGGEAKDLHAMVKFLDHHHWKIRMSRSERTERFLGHSIMVLKVDALNPNLFATIFQRVMNFNPKPNYYDGDISIPGAVYASREIVRVYT